MGGDDDTQICRDCGGPIIFRYECGRVVPIHLDGNGCPGRTNGAPRREELYGNTRCPRCSRSVYFVRHNGGSVWVDSLGWPWPIHGCFASETKTVLDPLYRAFAPSLVGPGAPVLLVRVTQERAPQEIGLYLRSIQHRSGMEFGVGDVLNEAAVLANGASPVLKPGGIAFLSSDRKRLWLSDGNEHVISLWKIHCAKCGDQIHPESMDGHCQECHRGVRFCSKCRHFFNDMGYSNHVNRCNGKPIPRK